MLSAEISARLGDPQNSDFNTKTAEVWMMFEIFSGPMTYFFGNPQIGPQFPIYIPFAPPHSTGSATGATSRLSEGVAGNPKEETGNRPANLFFFGISNHQNTF